MIRVSTQTIMVFANYDVIRTCEYEWFPAPELKDVNYDVEDGQQEVAETRRDQAERHGPETETRSAHNNYNNNTI